MAKKFAPRVKKKQRKVIDLSSKLGSSGYRMNETLLLQGAELEELNLKGIVVREQVRTKFNDSSLKELAENIKLNGLIQPLVVHLEKGKFTLICGERRFRAMGLIEKKAAPCFVLKNKSKDELMAIQFSENSSREELHYIDKADGILNYQKATKSSERQIMRALSISKSEVHRSLLIARLPKKLKEAAKDYNTEKYVLIELDALDKGPLKKKLEKMVFQGEITKRAQLKKAIAAGGAIKVTKGSKKTTAKKASIKRGTTASAFIKAMQIKSKDMPLDKDMKKLLKKLVEETQDMIGE